MEYYSQTFLLPFLIILTNLYVPTSGQHLYLCIENGSYTRNSTYYNNLNNLLSSLPSDMGDNGFYSASQGKEADRVYAIALCRGDIQLDACRSCVQQATNDIVKSCPDKKQAVLWANTCMLRYSNESFFGIPSDDPPIEVKNMATNASNPDQFNKAVSLLLDNLRTRAASGGPWMKVAVGNRTIDNSTILFGISQCTPDLSSRDCTGCLVTLARRIQDCCLDIVGARILVPSCNLNYEIFSFYNVTRIEEAQRMSVSPMPPLQFPVPSPAPMPTPLVPSPRGTDDNGKIRTIIIIVVPIILCLLLVACFWFVFWSKRAEKRLKETISSDDNEITTVESLQYDFNKIKEATNDFSEENKLGQGGFGAVYKGKLENGQEVAVKRLFNGSQQGEMEFRNEIMLLAKLQHRNLVRLFGFAKEGAERVVVYEFVKNGSLDRFLFDQTRDVDIGWDQRSKIIRGIVKGLLYLHEDSRLRIIHRDLKASNILLDATLNPKIADFGMAKLSETDESEANTRKIVGTYGYMPPEYVHHGRFSIKTDVYSFGVLAIEIINGQKNSNFRIDGVTSEESLLNFAWRNWHEGTIENLIDPVLHSVPSCFPEISRCVHIALLCIQERTYDRPTMASVGLMLSGSTVTLPTPLRPAFYVYHTSNINDSHLREMDTRESSKSPDANNLARPICISENDASITELHPR